MGGFVGEDVAGSGPGERKLSRHPFMEVRYMPKKTNEPKPAATRGRKKTEESRWLQEAVSAMQDKKAERIQSMDLRPAMGATFDCFLIGEALSGTQVRAIADGVVDKLYASCGLEPLHKEGYANAEWILLDYGGLVVHVFQRDVRLHYKLEELWGDAPLTTYEDGE